MSLTQRFQKRPDATDEERSGGSAAQPVREREVREQEVRDGAPAAAPVGGETTQERRHEAFGGVSWLSALAGWLAAAGLTAILAGILAAAGAVLAISDVKTGIDDGDAETIGLAGGIALLVVLAIGYFFGGYAAGRMARFDGGRQGAGVWVWGIVAAVIVAVLAAVGGSQYNVLDALNLPRVPIEQGTLTTGGAAFLGAALLVTLVAAVVGGKAGEGFHRKVDRVHA